MHTRRFPTARQGLAIALLACVSAVLACGIPESAMTLDSDLGVGGSGFESAKSQALELLRSLFPELSDAELAELSATISLDAVLALKTELTAARKAAAEFSHDLFATAEERVEERTRDLSSKNDGFPQGLEAIGRICTYNEEQGRGSVNLSGVFDGKQSVLLTESNLSLTIGEQSRPFSLSCLQNGSTVDVVFLIDITGSMSNVIKSVRNSVVSFINTLAESGLRGTISVVSFQDSVGVNTTFQQPEPQKGYERSPFFAPVALSDSAAVSNVRSFVNRLEANRGADSPENLAAAIDFARNNVIGYMSNGAPNIIGDGKEDPTGTKPFPRLMSERQVFVVFTDTAFHGNSARPSNSSLLAPFVPRNVTEILRSLNQTNTTVHVSDPSWIDLSTDPSEKSLDADYWAKYTGGLGEDRVLGYSLVDLELVVVAKETGLLDITLDQILKSSCSLKFEGALGASDEVAISLSLGDDRKYFTMLQVMR